LPIQKSDWRSMSATDHWAKKAASARNLVASSATALAPFSQNSAWWRLAGSGQAQPMQSKPSSWLMWRRVRAVRSGPISLMPCRSADTTAGTPAACSDGSLIFSPVSPGSFGGRFDISDAL
jgi:hypothetical protein